MSSTPTNRPPRFGNRPGGPGRGPGGPNAAPPRPAGALGEGRAGADLIDHVVHINRVTKVVKGGKNFSFSALVIVGDGKGRVGYGAGKAKEVPTAIKKGIEMAKKTMISVTAEGQDDPPRRHRALRRGPRLPQAGLGRHRRHRRRRRPRRSSRPSASRTS